MACEDWASLIFTSDTIEETFPYDVNLKDAAITPLFVTCEKYIETLEQTTTHWVHVITTMMTVFLRVYFNTWQII